MFYISAGSHHELVHKEILCSTPYSHSLTSIQLDGEELVLFVRQHRRELATMGLATLRGAVVVHLPVLLYSASRADEVAVAFVQHPARVLTPLLMRWGCLTISSKFIF